MDISSDDSATDFKYSSAVKGVPALSDNLASFSAVDLAIHTHTLPRVTIEAVAPIMHKAVNIESRIPRVASSGYRMELLRAKLL